MNPTQLNSTETKDRILKAFEKIGRCSSNCEIVSFGTVGLNGWPNVRVLLVAARDGRRALREAREALQQRRTLLKGKLDKGVSPEDFKKGQALLGAFDAAAAGLELAWKKREGNG